MHPTSSEKMQEKLISQIQYETENKSFHNSDAKSRYSSSHVMATPIKRSDHSADHFFGIINSDDYKYRRSRDAQQTEQSSLSKHAQRSNSRKNQLETPIKQSPLPSRHFRSVDASEINWRKDASVDLRLKTENLEIISNVFFSDKVQPQTGRSANRSPIGALTNKLYNCKIKQYPEQDKQNQITIQLEGNLKIDEVNLRRKLANEGIQVVSLEVPYQVITNTPNTRGQLKVRLDPKQDLEKVYKQLEQFGIKTQLPNQNHKIKAEQQQKVWLRQKIAYKQMGFFSNRDNDKPKPINLSVQQQATPKPHVNKVQHHLNSPGSLHKHLHSRINYK